MKAIPLTKGYAAFVDDTDFARANQFSWYAAVCKSGGVYAARTVTDEDGVRRTEFLHQFLLGVNSEVLVDHRNRDTLNNCRSNLRLSDKRGNSTNRPKASPAASSRYKGVYHDRARGKWQAYIKLRGQRIHLGRYPTEEDAARAYDRQAMHLFGDFACLNFPQEIAA